MSQENVELIRRAHDAFNRRDLDAFLEFIDPEVEFIARVSRASRAADPRFRGHDGIRELVGDLLGSSPEFSSGDPRICDSGRRAVIAAMRLRGAWQRERAPWTSRRDRHGRKCAASGKMIRWAASSMSEAEALEAAGLRSRRCRRRTWSSSDRCHRGVQPPRQLDAGSMLLTDVEWYDRGGGRRADAAYRRSRSRHHDDVRRHVGSLIRAHLTGRGYASMTWSTWGDGRSSRCDAHGQPRDAERRRRSTRCSTVCPLRDGLVVRGRALS